jgi:hypothetical protein
VVDLSFDDLRRAVVAAERQRHTLGAGLEHPGLFAGAGNDAVVAALHERGVHHRARGVLRFDDRRRFSDRPQESEARSLGLGDGGGRLADRERG